MTDISGASPRQVDTLPRYGKYSKLAAVKEELSLVYQRIKKLTGE